MRRGAFFDRDGTINIDFGHIYKKEDLVFVKGIPEVIKAYNEKNIPVIVVTNQAGIAKGYYKEEQMHEFNISLNKNLEKTYGAHIDAFYFCPHHPDFTGECECRKPKPGMINNALTDFGIDAGISILYGDKDKDRIAAHLAGIGEFVLVGNGGL